MNALPDMRPDDAATWVRQDLERITTVESAAQRANAIRHCRDRWWTTPQGVAIGLQIPIARCAAIDLLAAIEEKWGV